MKGSLSIDDGDGNGNENGKKPICLGLQRHPSRPLLGDGRSLHLNFIFFLKITVKKEEMNKTRFS